MQNNDTAPQKKKRRGLRPDGLIQVTIDVGFDENGKRKRKSFYGRTRAEAEAKRAEYVKQRDSGAAYDRNMTVAEWIHIYKTTYCENYNKLYTPNHDTPFNTVERAIGAYRIRDITESHLQRLLNDNAGRSLSTLQKVRWAINVIFAKAYKNKVIDSNPATELKLPQYTQGSHRVLESWEVSFILERWDEFDGGIWIMLMLLAGLRRSEMIALAWDNVDMSNRIIHVVQTAVTVHNKTIVEERAKTKAGIRHIPIAKPLWEALNRTPISQRTGYVCKSQRCDLLTEGAVSCGMIRLNKLMRKYAMNQSPQLHLSQDIRCHDLRHTFCTMLYNAGVDVYSAAYLMGHSNIDVTMKVYTHLTELQKAKASVQMLSFMDDLE